MDRKRNIFLHYPPDATANPYLPGIGPSVHSGYISDLVEDKEGNLWIGTSIGIDVLEAASGKFRHYVTEENNPSSLSNNNVISIKADSRGLIWIGTREGLNLFSAKDHSFTTFRTEEGLPDNAILNILEDADHSCGSAPPMAFPASPYPSTRRVIPPAGLPTTMNPMACRAGHSTRMRRSVPGQASWYSAAPAASTSSTRKSSGLAPATPS
jgi:hypothetical protein